MERIKIRTDFTENWINIVDYESAKHRLWANTHLGSVFTWSLGQKNVMWNGKAARILTEN